MTIFNTAANLQYKSTVGGLPSWIFVPFFVFLLLFIKFGATYEDTETGEKKQFSWIMATVVSLIITMVVMIGNWIRGGMFQARKRLFKKEGFTNAAGAAYQAQRMDNISSQISAIKQ